VKEYEKYAKGYNFYGPEGWHTRFPVYRIIARLQRIVISQYLLFEVIGKKFLLRNRISSSRFGRFGNVLNLLPSAQLRLVIGKNLYRVMDMAENMKSVPCQNLRDF
jgi:hypothetical protein